MRKASHFGFEVMFLLAGSVFAVLSRWIYKSQYLFHWDSVQFALALNNFDVAKHQPHPPGYVFYVWLGQIYNYFFGDSNLALIALGITFTVLGLVGVFYLTKFAFKNVTAAYIASLLYLLNSSVWFHGAVAEVYIVESTVALWAVCLLYRAWKQPTMFNLILGSALLGLLGGFRQVTEVALLPLFVYVLIVARASRRQYLYVGVSWLVVNLLWFVPLVVNVGGVGSYFAANYQLSKVVFIQDFFRSGAWSKFVLNMRYQLQALRLTILAESVILFLAAAPYLIRGSSARYKIKWPEVWFWTLAVGVPLIVPIVTLTTNPGYVLTPAVLVIVLASAGLAHLWRDINVTYKTIIFGVLVVGLATFQLFNFYNLHPEQIKYISPSLASIERHDEILSEIIGIIQDHNQSDNVAVWVTSPDTVIYFGTRHLQYYLPNIDIYRTVPDSFMKEENELVWHARGETSWFESEAVVSKKIDKMFVIRELWDKPHGEYAQSVQLANGRYLIYYNTADRPTQEFMQEQFPFVFEGRNE